MNSSFADMLSKAKIAELIGSVVEEGDVYRMRLDDREGVVGKDGAINQRHAGNPPVRRKDRPLLSYQQSLYTLRSRALGAQTIAHRASNTRYYFA